MAVNLERQGTTPAPRPAGGTEPPGLGSAPAAGVRGSGPPPLTHPAAPLCCAVGRRCLRLYRQGRDGRVGVIKARKALLLLCRHLNKD